MYEKLREELKGKRYDRFCRLDLPYEGSDGSLQGWLGIEQFGAHLKDAVKHTFERRLEKY